MFKQIMGLPYVYADKVNNLKKCKINVPSPEVQVPSFISKKVFYYFHHQYANKSYLTPLLDKHSSLISCHDRF